MLYLHCSDFHYEDIHQTYPLSHPPTQRGAGSSLITQLGAETVQEQLSHFSSKLMDILAAQAYQFLSLLHV